MKTRLSARNKCCFGHLNKFYCRNGGGHLNKFYCRNGGGAETQAVIVYAACFSFFLSAFVTVCAVCFKGRTTRLVKG
jgi:hypothetical protein